MKRFLYPNVPRHPTPTCTDCRRQQVACDTDGDEARCCVSTCPEAIVKQRMLIHQRLIPWMQLEGIAFILLISIDISVVAPSGTTFASDCATRITRREASSTASYSVTTGQRGFKNYYNLNLAWGDLMSGCSNFESVFSPRALRGFT